jgi:hypothetical protein
VSWSFVESWSSLLIGKVIKTMSRLIESWHNIPSLGCIGNRLYAVLGDDQLYFAIPVRESRTEQWKQKKLTVPLCLLRAAATLVRGLGVVPARWTSDVVCAGMGGCQVLEIQVDGSSEPL